LWRLKVQTADTDFYGPAKAAAAGGKPAIAVLPGYFPAELIAAAGGHPFRVWGGRPDTVMADAMLQSYICSMAKAVLEDIVSGTLGFAAAFVVPTVCDSMQNMSDLIASTGKKVFCMRIPRTTFRADGERWLVHETGRFCEWIAGVTGKKPDEASLVSSAADYGAARNALQGLYARRRGGEVFDPEQFYTLIMSSEGMDPRDAAAAASGIPPGAKGRGARVVVSGTAPLPLGFLRSFPEAGLEIADDDLMACSRILSRPMLGSFSPAGIFEAFAGGEPCSSNTFGHDGRAERLIAKVKAAGAAGVVFWETKACENEGFDLPWLAEKLRDAGILSTVVETEQKMRTFETAANRLAAFAEGLPCRSS
jgi:benzoyl-CoA reductase/2-hydroxyglutaryl-CoA dehydratase subunit BcrC/BadD/HgdB